MMYKKYMMSKKENTKLAVFLLVIEILFVASVIQHIFFPNSYPLTSLALILTVNLYWFSIVLAILFVVIVFIFG